MFLFFLLSISVCVITILLDSALVLLWPKKDDKIAEFSDQLPFISVLVAARNEEKYLPCCLKSLLKVNYPASKMEILVGNDASTDNTYRIAKEYDDKFDQVKVIDIKERWGLAKGKANVLAHLAKKAQGDLFLITDADVEVPENWIQTYLKYFDKNTGILTGMTSIKAKSAFSKLQEIDWMFALGMLKVVSERFRPVTTMGNNMLVSREAYEATGGYESIPFSITEDFALFKAVYAKGFGVKQLFDPQINAWTQAIEDIPVLLQQRKRWMRGAIQLPIPIVFLLTAQALFFPAFLLLLIFQIKWAFVLLSVKLGVQSLFIAKVYRRLSIKADLFWLLAYECYSIILSLSLMVFFVLPLKLDWKGRKY
ncbi:glycosyltransferase [Xanthovirga aplysinae]|uniref:glycosyltransferase n=1 Tax=Xanthovirga aplysinae TaxID=2529853 RepID=UPI0012BBE863|nr:glycosyltransferase [Xanthovirga aplysinae]MTI32786.1 glycosyltransferase [Xanthovirga aplysinae]